MGKARITTSADALIALLRSSLNFESGQVFGHLVLYTSFGVVRGRTSLAFAQELARQGDDLQLQVIELNDVTVEHYSNHIPTASFERLYVNLDDIQGFALVKTQMQA